MVPLLFRNVKFKMSDKILILVILVVSFFINAIKFISIEGSDKPLPRCLFNMIINLLLIILSLNEKKMKKEIKNSTLDKYFKFKPI